MPFITVQGAESVRFHYEVLGKKTVQPALILISGYACDINLWRPVAEQFAGQTQVLIFDNQGIGKTEDSAGELTIQEMATSTKALVDALFESQQLKDGPYDVAGFAMGGLIAQQFAADYADATNRLILLNSVLKFNGEAKAGCEAMCKAREEGDFTKYAEVIYDQIVGDKFRAANKREGFVLVFATMIKDAQSAKGQRRQVELLKICDTTSVAPHIVAPTLLVQAEPRDIFALPEEVGALAAAISSNGTAVSIHKVESGHATIL